ncbi:hypothetical protein [Streptomyces olindensis]|uniref:hypothetical protein n=1 Tax=Streptomyces olindensis TaxID=358823 RepID=UPI00365B8624
MQLLNYAVHRDVADDCAWHSERKIIYFRPTPDFKPRSIRGASSHKFLVFNPKFKKASPDEISYCKHAALEWQFLNIGDQWYCALIPTFHYTRDGVRDSLYLSELLTGIKQLDRNPAVYGQTRMWATYLHGEDGVLNPRETILSYGELVTHTVGRAINDAEWLANPRKADTDRAEDADEEIEADELIDNDLTLFEVEL